MHLTGPRVPISGQIARAPSQIGRVDDLIDRAAPAQTSRHHIVRRQGHDEPEMRYRGELPDRLGDGSHALTTRIASCTSE